ncbi:adhesion G protein-coupled receptor L2-like [Dendronephthya gigantea]|uniref:adhesion G protein-coupled receptor L2-like n=1 Tax=Dendronephthya gigantea TaxID=151771 RepID=UPI00106B9426|nr:adhesion G protein-coupled receptor L2-like [Dendronephthya gigantea]
MAVKYRFPFVILMFLLRMESCIGQVCQGNEVESDFCYAYILPSSGALRLSWNDADAECKKMGAQLVSIDGTELNDLLKSTFSKFVNDRWWIGMSKCGGSWCYPNGYPTSYTNWYTGQPSNSNGNENCVEMWPDGVWNDAPCFETYPFICEKHVITQRKIIAELQSLKKEADDLYSKNISDEVRRERAQEIIKELTEFTDLDKVAGGENGADKQILSDAVEILQKIVNLNISDGSLKVLDPANNILDERNSESWRNISEVNVIPDLVTTLENYGLQYGEEIRNNTNGFISQNSSNVQLRVRYMENTAGNFTLEDRRTNFPNASFIISSDAIPEESGSLAVVVWYKTLNSFLGEKFHTSNDYVKVNSKIITASVRPQSKILQFTQPVQIIWDTNGENNDGQCAYWIPESGENRWKTDGCIRVEDQSGRNRSICECNHLTAFATIDISRNLLSKGERKALEVISTIGCSLSLIGVFLTIATYALLWKSLHKNVKTNIPSQVLLNLCVAIGMTDIFAIIAGPAQKHETTCIVISILLYFSILAIFGWMFCEGIIIYLQLVNVYSGLALGGKHLKAFYVIGWGIPVVLVPVLVGANDRKDFITDHACWCRGDGALFWIFVCTIVIILLINLVIFVLALRNALSSSHVSTTRSETDTKLRKAKIGVKGSAVLLPILGLTWVFGLLVFNRDAIVFKYLFAIFNSIQGLMIFVFHVLINKKVYEAINSVKKARDAKKMNNVNASSSADSTFSTSATSPTKSKIPMASVISAKVFYSKSAEDKDKKQGKTT